MNAAAKHMAQQHVWEGRLTAFVISPRIVALLLLISMVLASAVAIVYQRGEYRTSVSHLQGLQAHQYDLQLEHKQLLIERSTWASPTRVEHIAKQRLNMVMPRGRQIQLVGE